ncbi:MAG: hypothetical protein NVV62_16690 [Terricaulis sp.]|nr:hypothetical protein [Terricaulis sp.]
MPVAVAWRRGQQVAFHAHHHHLRLGIAEARIVFDGFGPSGEHEAGIENALIGRAAFGKAPGGGSDRYCIANSYCSRVMTGAGAIGAHTAGIGAGIVEGALVISGGGEGQERFTIAEDEEANFLAFHEFFDDDGGAGSVPAPEKQSMMASSASSTLMATVTPLSAARPSALITMGAPWCRYSQGRKP